MAANDVKIVLTAQDSTQGAFASARRGLEGIKEQATSLQAGLAGLGAALAGSVAVVHIKGAIDTLDQLDDLAEKTGIAAEQLSILRYAGEVAGTPLESLAKGIQKLSINMAAAAGGSKEQQAAFDALGVSLKGVGGALKGSDQVLGELANKFSSFRDGPEKAALAVELFGKAGADLIPVLNKGEAGIAALGDEAQRLGLVINGDLAAAAGAFNDNVKRIQLSSEAAYQTIAGQLLPTLNELAKVFLETRDGSQSAATYIGQGLKTTLETVAVVGANVSFVLKTIGTEAGAIAAQIVALSRLDLDGFNAISEAVKADAQRARTELDALERRILGITSNAGAGRGTAADPRALGAVQSIELQTRAWREAAPVIKKAGDAAKETADEFERLYAKITGKDAGVDADFGKNIATLNKGLAQGKISLEQYIDVVTRYANQQPRAVEAVKAATKAAEDRQSAALKEADAIREAIAAQEKAWSDALAGVTGRIQTLRDEETAAQLSAAAHISLAEAVEQVAIARLQEKQAGFIDGGEGYLAIQREIDARRELLTVIRGSEARKAAEQSAKDAADAWQRTADQIGQSLTDQIMAGGKNGAEYLRNLFRTLVLRPTIEYAARSLVGAGASLLGVGTPATAQAGNLLSGAGSVLSGASSIGNYAGTTLANLTGTGLDGFLATNAAFGTAAGGLNTLISGLSAAAPYLALAGGIYALAKQLDHSGTPHTGAGSGYSAAGGLMQASQGAVFNSGFTGINYSASTEQMTTGLVQSIVGILDSTAVTFGKAAGYQAAASFADDSSKDGAWGSLFIKNLQGVLVDWQAGGQSFRTFSDGNAGSSEWLAAISADVRTVLDGLDLPDWAQKTLDKLGNAPSLDQLAGAVAEITRVQNAIAGQRAGLQQQLDLLTGVTTQREIERNALDESNRALYDQIMALQDQKAATEAAAEAARAVAAERAGLQQQLDLLTGVTTQREIERAALDESNRALYDQIQALQDQKAATEATAEAERALAAERSSLMDQLWQATNNTAAIRAKQLAGLDPSNRPIQQALYDIADAQTAFQALQTSVQAERDRLTQKYNADKAALQQQAAPDLGYLKDAMEAQKAAISEELKLKQQAYSAQISAAQDAASDIRAIAGTLANAVKSVRIESDAFDLARLQGARRLIAGAAASGNIKASGLDDALSLAAQDSKRFYATFEDYAFDQAKAAADIAKLNDSAQEQLSGFDQTILALKAQDDLAKALADAQIKAIEAQYQGEMSAVQTAAAQAAADNAAQLAMLEAQYTQDIEALDATMADAQKQLDALLGIDSSVKTVAQAIDAFGDAVLQALAATSAVAAQAAIDQARAAAAAVPSPFYGPNTLTGPPPVKAGMYGFAVGTDYVPYDMVAQIHEGEAIVPKAYNPAAGAQTNRELVAEIKALREAVEAGQRAIAENTLTTAKTLKSWHGDGLPETREV